MRRRTHNSKGLCSCLSLINCMTLDRHLTPLSLSFLLYKLGLMRTNSSTSSVMRTKGTNPGKPSGHT